MHIISLQEILEEAGFHHVQNGVGLFGETDGNNTVFVADRKPLTDNNYDDRVTAKDLTVYVDNIPVDIASVDAKTGVIRLVDAPEEGSTVTADYVYTVVSDEYIKKIRKAAEGWIFMALRNAKLCSSMGDAVFDSGLVAEMCRNYAAARLLIREYGYNQDIEGTSKDGYKRLEQVQADLEKFIQNGGDCGGNDDLDDSSASNGRMLATSDGDFFKFDDNGYSSDRYFERRMY